MQPVAPGPEPGAEFANAGQRETQQRQQQQQQQLPLGVANESYVPGGMGLSMEETVGAPGTPVVISSSAPLVPPPTIVSLPPRPCPYAHAPMCPDPHKSTCPCPHAH